MEGEKEEIKKAKIAVTIEDSDVFETEDLPEDEQHKDFSYTMADIEGIDQGRLDIKEAFKCFEDKTIDGFNTDFSDSIAINKSGYKTSKKEKLESVAEKQERLKRQVEELKQEVALLKDKDTDNVTDLMTKVGYLGRQLSSVVGGSGVVGDAVKLENDRGNRDGRRLIHDLDAFLSTPPTTTTTTQQAPQTPTDYTQYDLICNDKHKIDSLLLEGLEQRVSRCETVVGKLNTPALSSSENPNKSILGALSLVVARFSLLDLSQLGQFESSLLAIHQKVLQASAKSDASDIADKVDKLSRTYEVVKKSDAVLERLSSIQECLSTHAMVHEEATQFSKALKQVSEGQKDLSEGVQEQADHLKQIQALLAPQMQLFEDNCQHIEALIN